MNKKVLKLFGAVSVLTLVSVAGCGGDDIFGTTCPAGGFKLEAGSYSTTQAMIVSDTCGFMTSDLMTSRTVDEITTGGTCSTKISSSSGNEVGSGAISNNTGALTYSATETAGACTYDVTITSTITVTADNTFTLQATYSESNYKSVQGQTCTMLDGCSTSYSVSMKK